MNLRDLLRRDPDSTTLRETIDQLAGELAAAGERQTALLTDRETVYLSGTPDDIATLQSSIASGMVDIDRLTVQVAGLQKKLAEAEVREEQRRLATVTAEGEAALDRAIAILGRYVKIAAGLPPLFLEYREALSVIARVNTELRGAGRSPLAVPEEVVRRRADGRYTSDFTQRLVLPDPFDCDRMLFDPS
ncbi:MAG: hypothetical protein HQL42_20050 [Alphaproteobacteria bacterium]|nr:hypothetical protein [Alphaproteobacteria bacterium]